MKNITMFTLCLTLATLSTFETATATISHAVAVDALGNVYISGETYGSLEGPNAGEADAFLTKFDSSGNELWGRQIGTSSPDISQAVAVDALGNVYISGETRGSLEGPNFGVKDAFLTKFDSSGNELWGRQIGASSHDVSYAVAVDALGNAYISGYTYAGGYADAFLTKFDSSGNELWGRQIGTSSNDASRAVAVDASGNAYISGYTSGSLEGPHAGGYSDAFLTKFDSSGNELWGRQIGTSSPDISFAVAVDALGNAYISGYTGASLEGPYAGGHADAFLTKFDSSGNELWGRQIGASSHDFSNAVAVDALGNAYISGYTIGSLEGPSAGGTDAFLTKFDSSGNELWGRQIGTSSGDVSYAVAVDALGNAYISGRTNGSLEGPNSGSADAFLTKFDSSGNELWGRQIGTGIPEPSTLLFGAMASMGVMLRWRGLTR